jgi:hypothetical protein
MAMPIAFWCAACDPFVLTARAEASRSGDPEALDLLCLPLAATVLRDSPGHEYVLIADGQHHIRLELYGDSIAEGPVRLRYDISGIRDLRVKTMLLTRLETLVRRKRLPSRLFPRDPVAERWLRAFFAWEANRNGASQIDIAIAIFGENMVTESSADYMRKRVARLLALADRRIAAGFGRFFGGEARTADSDGWAALAPRSA